MNFLMNKKMKEHSTEDFYSNINKLYKLIVISFEKEQTKNSEKYINYLFEVIVKYYQKTSRVLKSDQSTNSFEVVTSESDIEILGVDRSGKQFPNRKIEPFFGDFFISRIIGLISLNIKSGRFDAFYFCLSRFKDSIRILLKNSETYESASLLMSQFKFIADKIYASREYLSNYEKSWFLAETYNWFFEMYSTNFNSTKELELFEREIVHIFRYYIDNDRVDIFKKFLLGLSSGIFHFSYERDLLLNKFDPKQYPDSFTYNEFIRKIKRDAKKFKNLYKIQAKIDNLDTEVDKELASFFTSKNDLKLFKSTIKELFFAECKITYLKLILIKIIVYSFFKHKYDFFQIYLNYHQPDDSEAHWSNKYYGIESVDEFFDLLEDGEKLIIEDNSFWIDHHGFRIYLNTFIGYYILKFKEVDLVGVIKARNNYKSLFAIEQFLIDIKNKNNLKDLKDIGKINFSKFEMLLEKLIYEATQKISTITKHNIIAGEVDKAYVKDFKNFFLEVFLKMATLRSLYNLFGLYTSINETGDVKGMGVNVLLPKEAFLKESTVMYFNMAAPYANQMAENENISIIYSLLRACEDIQLTKAQFENFLINNIDDYDLIISKGNYLGRSDFQELQFEESWTFESEFNNISDYIGRIEKRINAFNINLPSKEGYILLNSKKLGNLKQLLPPDIKSGEKLDFFTFSLIDFKDDRESLNKHVESNISQEKLLELVWVRIFERFQLEIGKEFNGKHIELIG